MTISNIYCGILAPNRTNNTIAYSLNHVSGEHIVLSVVFFSKTIKTGDFFANLNVKVR